MKQEKCDAKEKKKCCFKKNRKKIIVGQRAGCLDGDACRIRLKSDPVSAAS